MLALRGVASRVGLRPAALVHQALFAATANYGRPLSVSMLLCVHLGLNAEFGGTLACFPQRVVVVAT